MQPQLWCYGGSMEIGVRQAKAELSRLIDSALDGETVIITNHGKPLARLVPQLPPPDPRRGFGCLKGLPALQPGWDSPEVDRQIEKMFERKLETKKRRGNRVS